MPHSRAQFDILTQFSRFYYLPADEEGVEGMMGHVDRFDVIFDNKKAIFHEGDRVGGIVNIVNKEDIKFRGLA